MSAADRPRVNARLGTMVLTQIRLTERQRALIDQAAHGDHLSRSEYLELLLRLIRERSAGELPAVELPERLGRRRETRPTQVYLVPETRAELLAEAQACGAGISLYFERLLEMFVSSGRLPSVARSSRAKGARSRAA